MARCLSLVVLLDLICLTLVLSNDLEKSSNADQREDNTGEKGRPSARGPTASKNRNFYDFKVKTITGKEMELDEFRGQVLLVVNLASHCGFTDNHYKALVVLHQALAPTNKFNVLGFPCNQFGAQEPDSENIIHDFVKKNYNVQFPMFTKVNVIEPHTHEIFKYLQEKTGKTPNWNFWKYLVNHKGDVIGVYPPWMGVDELTLDVRGAVNDAVKADPRDAHLASGPPKRAHEDYGDGAGGGVDIWSEGMPENPENPSPAGQHGIPGNRERAQRAGSKPGEGQPERVQRPGSKPGEGQPERVQRVGSKPGEGPPEPAHPSRVHGGRMEGGNPELLRPGLRRPSAHEDL